MPILPEAAEIVETVFGGIETASEGPFTPLGYPPLYLLQLQFQFDYCKQTFDFLLSALGRWAGENKNETTSQITESVQPILAAPDSCLLSEFQPLLEPAAATTFRPLGKIGGWTSEEQAGGAHRSRPSISGACRAPRLSGEKRALCGRTANR